MDQNTKKQILKDIILRLHQGTSPTEAKERFEREIGTVTSVEIAELEQSLISEGLSPDDIKQFCNVHALIFQSALEKTVNPDTFPGHPIHLFKLENREIEKLTRQLREVTKSQGLSNVASLKADLGEVLLKLKGVELHYERKEQLLFPLLEKRDFMGPSKVMWGKDNEIRELLRNALSGLEGLTEDNLGGYFKNPLTPLCEELEGMIFKEENILFPVSLEKLAPGDWVDILSESDEIGYFMIEKPEETQALVRNLKMAVIEDAVVQDGGVVFPTGRLGLNELMAILNALPIEITFVDRDDTLRYFSESNNRVFHRTKSAIGRKVQNCHPPQSVERVERILASFKEGRRDSAEFWMKQRGKFVHIRFLAVRDRNQNYLGTMEIVQDISEIKELTGEKRLLDERA